MRGKPHLEILKDLHVFGPPEYKNVVSDMPSVCLSDVWMYASAVPEGLAGFHSYSVFQSLCHGSVPGKYKYSRPKNMDPWDGQQKRHGNFLENGSNDSD
jgi:hypothetical protein